MVKLEEGLRLFELMENKSSINNCKDDIEEFNYEGGLSTFRISASTPTRGGGLLVFDAEKNDYDWLVTPPRTPLYPSLNREGSAPNISQGSLLTGSALAKNTLMEGPSWNSRLLSVDGLDGVQMAATRGICGHLNPKPPQANTASPQRTSTCSIKARSPSPSPSSTKSHRSIRDFSPCRSSTSTTKGRSPVTPSQLTSKSLAFCRHPNRMSPLSEGRHGYLGPRGPKQLQSPRSCASEPPTVAFRSPGLSANLYTSPWSQRGSAERFGKGHKFSTRGSSMETSQNCRRPKCRALSADNVESSSFSNKCGQINGGSPSTNNNITARRNITTGLSMTASSLKSDNKRDVKGLAPVSSRNNETHQKSFHNMLRPSSQKHCPARGSLNRQNLI